MSAVNNVTLIGRLTADPEIRENGDNKFGRATVAVNRDFKNKEGNYEADFINITYNGKTAEFIEKYFHKGDPIIVQGSVRTGSYTNKEGNKVYTTDIATDRIAFVPGSKSSEGGAKKEDDFLNIPDGGDDILPWN